MNPMVSGSEENPCPYQSGCPLYPRFTSRVVLRIYMQRYCFGDYRSCARYRLSSVGERPDPDLLPDGDRLAAAQ